MSRRISRTILAMLVALAVATLPAATSLAGVAASAATLSASSAMPDCGHHHHAARANETQKIADDFACMAACALTCFNFPVTAFSSIPFSLPASGVLKPVGASRHVSSLMGTPPFRPPRS